jgi:hypothetical protein
MLESVILLFALPGEMPAPVLVEFAVPGPLEGFANTFLELQEADAPGAPVIPVWRAQVGPWSQPWCDRPLCALIPPPVTGTRPVRYVLRTEAPIDGPFALMDDGRGKLLLSSDDRPVLTYNYGPMLADGVPEDRRRSCYVHPILGLDGETITGDFEPDHYHHRGLFWAWPNMTVDGQTVSLWDLRGIEARFEKRIGGDQGSVAAVFGVQNGWYVGEKRVAEEEVWFRVWRATEVGRAIDVHLTLTAGDSPITLLGAAGKGYGGLCFRVRTVNGKTVTKSDGQTVESTNEERLPWADLSGEFGAPEGVSGAAVFIGAGNPGFPNGWCLRQYGIIGVDWPGLEASTLRPGQPVTLNYRVWLHRGDAATGRVAEAYGQFADPIRVELSD